MKSKGKPIRPIGRYSRISTHSGVHPACLPHVAHLPLSARAHMTEVGMLLVCLP